MIKILFLYLLIGVIFVIDIVLLTKIICKWLATDKPGRWDMR